MKIKNILLIAFILIQNSFFAQVTIPNASPAASIKQTIGYTEVTIEYNRPSLRNRDMFEDLTREGEVWRTGANMATRLTLSDKITIGGKELSPGKYSIYSIPGKKEWTIIINRKISWGTQYDEKLDLVRIKVPTLKSKENHESFTFYFSNTTEDSAILGFAWENTKVELSLNADVHQKTLDNINAVMADESKATTRDFFMSTEYYLKKGLNPQKALKWATIVADRVPNRYGMVALKARAQANIGKYKEAVITGKKVIELAEKAKNLDYVHNYKKLIAVWEKKSK